MALCIRCLEIIYRGADYLNLISPVGFKRIRNNIQASVLNLSITLFRWRWSGKGVTLVSGVLCVEVGRCSL